MSDDRRDILTAVAEGRLSAEEAAERLEELDRLQAPEPKAETPVRGSISRIRVSARYRKVRVIGDPSVLEAVAEGPHTVRRDGDTLAIDSDDEAELRPEPSWFRFGERAWSRARERHLHVRVNPALALEADSSAGSLWVTGTRAPLRVEVFAGSARLEDVAGPFDILTHAGSVQVRSRLERGTSRIRCEAGSVNLQLEEGSSVRVCARSVLGRVLLPEPVGGPGGTSWGISDQRFVTVGDGVGTLDIETNMGSVSVRTSP